MKFVALVSGGKDSCFNISHCIKLGHELIALANLYPEDRTRQELDSFMFQTVGHDVLDFYSECCEVPMYRQAITGTSKNQKLEYSETSDDEIEDLYKLLQKVKAYHPDVEAVSVGAILSSYQRTRVEHVCQRLGLISLAFLWQRNQLELMTEMCNSRLDARLIKVAAIGLDERHLMKSIQEMLPILIQLNKLYDVHICGEGGEFETLVLDAPFFKSKKLEVVKQEVIRDSGDVWYAKLGVKVVSRDANIFKDWEHSVTQPPLLNENFFQIYKQLDEDESFTKAKTESKTLQQSLKLTKQFTGNKLFISNIASQERTLEGQAKSVFTQLQEILKQEGLAFENIQNSQLLVASMADFASVNSVYQTYFEKPLPPSRICVETTLPRGTLLQLSVTVLTNLADKKGIHIQGRSFWAPSNIGPYSQAILDTKNRIATISGQIPLIPATMELHPDPKVSTVLSLQHFHVVKELVGFTKTASTVAFVVDEQSLSWVLDAWSHYEKDYPQALVVVKVPRLPRNATVEWGGASYEDMPDVDASEDENEAVKESSTSPGVSLRKVNGEIFETLFLSFDDFESKLRSVHSYKSYQYALYAHPGEFTSNLEKFVGELSLEFVPTLGVWDHRGIKHDIALVVRSN